MSDDSFSVLFIMLQQYEAVFKKNPEYIMGIVEALSSR
jgi:hypothetical protein